MKKPILVTGGAGFIGSNLIRILLDNDERVVNLDALTYAGNIGNLSDINKNPHHEFIEGSINDGDLVIDLLNKFSPKAVVNLAAESHVDRSISGADPFIKTNLEGVYCLLETTRRYIDETLKGDTDEFRFLHVSTDEVYGSIDSGTANESKPYQPNSPYAASKAGADHLVRAWHQTYGMPNILTNCCNNYGPYQYPEKLIPLMMIKAIQNEPLPVYGDGKNERQWIHVEDHCRALKCVLDNGKIGESYNIGGDTILDNVSVVKTICRTLDTLKPRDDSQKHETAIEFVEDRPGHDKRYALDSSKIKKQLNWEPMTNFDDGLKQTVSWYLKNSSWWQAALTDQNATKRLGLLKT